MARFYTDADADLEQIREEPIAIIGYGNQGRAQALNLRDSGLRVLVGNLRDAYWQQAVEDGFQPMSPTEAAREGRIICLLVPDEVQQQLYERDIAPALQPGDALDFAHGYSIRYGLIRPPAEADVIMVAPRMIGAGVRELFLKGSGAPCAVAVEQDATGRAWRRALALAKGIGATRTAALETTFAEETELDHFTEQAVMPIVFSLLVESFELLVERGYQPEMVALELWASGEPSETWGQIASMGLFRQLDLHSRTSQYGTLTRSTSRLREQLRAVAEKALAEIRSGAFAREWESERTAGYAAFNKLKQQALSHPLNEVEQTIREALRRARE
jgi:ketol-acid reductoisomerase